MESFHLCARRFANFGLAFFALTTAVSTVCSAATNLVQNPGFETGNFSSWTQAGNTASSAVNTTDPHSGTFAGGFHAVTQFDVLSQNIATTPGNSYIARFFLANPVGGSVAEFHLLIGGTTFVNFANETFSYREFNYGFTATGSTTTLRFDFRQDFNSFYLDDVSVTLAPPRNVLYVTNTDGTIMGFDPSGNRTLVATSSGNSNLSSTLNGIACDAFGNIYIADQGKNQIFKIDPTGTGAPYFSISTPNGLAIDTHGNLAVGAPDGVHQIDFLGIDSKIYSTSDALKGIATDNADNVYIGDFDLNTISEINSSGGFVNSFGTNSVKPLGVTASDGAVRATLSPSAEVVEYAPNGTLSDLQVNLRNPTGIVDDGVGDLFVADGTGNTIVKLDANGQVSTYADTLLVSPKYATLGPAITAPLIAFTPHANPAPFENSGTDSITITRSGALNQTSTVMVTTVSDTTYSPQLFHQGFFAGVGTKNPHYFSTNDAQFQDAIRALSGRDYQPISVTLGFAPNETSKTVSIPMLNNNAANGRRRLVVALAPVNAPLTVGPNLNETIIDDDARAEITGLSNLQSSVAADGTRTVSVSFQVLNVSSSATGPIRVRLFGHSNFVNPPNPAPSPPPDVNLGVTPVVVSQSLAVNGTATANFNNVTIPAPAGDAYSYNTWYWVFAAVEEQVNGTWVAAASPWLVIDGVRLVSGYVNRDGSTTPRDLWSGGGVDTGTPGTTVGGNGGSGLVNGGGPAPSPTPPIAGLIPFVLDGQADFPGANGVGYQLNSTNPKLYASVRQAPGRTLLYVATQSPGTGGDSHSHDAFVFVTDQLLATATEAAPWGKSGKIACSITKPFLAGESKDDYLAWYNCGNGAQSTKLNSATGVMEGVLDVGSAFGSVPSVLYFSAASYGTLNGDTLATQSPPGNGDANIDPNEFLAFPISALIDQNADGKYDRLDPKVAFRLNEQRTTNGQPSATGTDLTITWPAFPAKSYQVYFTDSLTNSWQTAPNGLVTAPAVPPFADTLSYTLSGAMPTGVSHLFLKVQMQ